jgi:hypothetical protein
MARLTDKTLAQSTAITPTTLIHIVYTGDPSQNVAGSSYKAELNQIAPIVGGYQYYSEVSVTSSELLTLNSLPIEILPAPGVDKYYDFKVYFEYYFGTLAYVSNPIYLVDDTGKYITANFDLQAPSDSVLISNMVSFSNFSPINSSLTLFTPTTDPTSGDGDLKIKIWYNVVDFG